MKKLKILMLPIHESGVAYYRFHLPTLALRAAGHEVLAWEDGLYAWCSMEDYEGWLAQQLDQGVDVIHGGWSSNLAHLELLVAARERYKVPVVIDYDDDILNVDAMNVNYKVYHEGAFSRRVARLGMRVADAVTVSTAPLQKSLQQECRAIHHLPNFTHPPHWAELPTDPQRVNDKSVRVMFAGGPSHLGDLHHVKDAVEWMMGYYDGKEGRPHVKLFFVTCAPDWAEKWMENTREPWRNRAFYMETGGQVAMWHRVIKWIAPDILMAPLQHNKFNESKSLIKAYDAAMVEGCAFACEDWPAYEEVPNEACAKVNECDHYAYPNWKDALKELVENTDLRHSLSRKLVGWAVANRAISAHTTMWEDVYQKVMDAPRVSGMGDVVRPRIYAPNGGLARDLE